MVLSYKLYLKKGVKGEGRTCPRKQEEMMKSHMTLRTLTRLKFLKLKPSKGLGKLVKPRGIVVFQQLANSRDSSLYSSVWSAKLCYRTID